MTINMKLYDIAAINEGILDVKKIPGVNQTVDAKNNVITDYIKDFLISVTTLQDYQTKLSQQTAGLPPASRALINPTNVTLTYFTSPLTHYSFNIWESIIQLQVISYQLSDSLTITYTDPSFLFITHNCLNSVLSALQSSTQAIVDQSDRARTSNLQVFLVLLMAVSGALGMSMMFLLPVVRRAKMNRQEVYELYTLKKVEKHIDEQLKKSRWFIAKY